MFVPLQDEEAFAKASAEVESEIAGQAAELAALKVSFEKVDKEVADLRKAATRNNKEGDAAACSSLRTQTHHIQAIGKRPDCRTILTCSGCCGADCQVG